MQPTPPLSSLAHLHPSLPQQRETVQALNGYALAEGYSPELLDQCFIHPRVRGAVGKQNSWWFLWNKVLQPILDRRKHHSQIDHRHALAVSQPEQGMQQNRSPKQQEAQPPLTLVWASDRD